jgi:exosortase E/protease (VPEID-CTERM system)
MGDPDFVDQEIKPLSLPLKPTSPVGIRRSLPLWRWILLVSLLGTEVVILTTRFDVHDFGHQDQWWAQLLGKAGHIPPLAIATAVALLLCRGARLAEDLRRLAGAYEVEPHGRWWAYLFGHLGALAVFSALSINLLRGPLESGAYAEGRLLAWAVMGLATALLWIAALLPPGIWVGLGPNGAGALLTGVGVGALACLAGRPLQYLWVPLSQGTLWTVSLLLRVVTADIISRPAEFIIGTSKFRVAIGSPCSGYEGIGLIWVLLSIYLWQFRRELRFPRALLLFPLGTAVIWLANSVRIAALVLIGSYASRDVATGGFHSQAGWLAFNAVGLGLIAISYRTHFFRAPGTIPASEQGANPVAAYLAPMMALIGVTMVVNAVSHSPGFDRFYAVHILVAAAVLWFYRRDYPDLRWEGNWGAFLPPVALGIVVFALWMALEPAPTSGSAEPMAEGLGQLPRAWAAAWLVFRVAGSVIVVPLAEELAFRGYAIRRLIDADFTAVAPGRFSWLSFLVSSALFGALHGRWLAGTLAGLVYALALYRRKELADAVVAHATTNALIAATVLATGSWSLWAR